MNRFSNKQNGMTRTHFFFKFGVYRVLEKSSSYILYIYIYIYIIYSHDRLKAVTKIGGHSQFGLVATKMFININRKLNKTRKSAQSTQFLSDISQKHPTELSSK